MLYQHKKKRRSEMNRILSIAVSIIGIVAIIVGTIFVVQGFSKNNLIVERMKIEKVGLALDPANPNETTQIQTSGDAQEAADIIAEHRRALSPTYQDLLAGGRFDATNPKHLTYAQAMNLENYLYLAVTVFGLVQVVLAAGAFMIITGVALVITGYLLSRNKTKVS
jgi:hypothetical protein